MQYMDRGTTPRRNNRSSPSNVNRTNTSSSSSTRPPRRRVNNNNSTNNTNSRPFQSSTNTYNANANNSSNNTTRKQTVSNAQKNQNASSRSSSSHTQQQQQNSSNLNSTTVNNTTVSVVRNSRPPRPKNRSRPKQRVTSTVSSSNSTTTTTTTITSNSSIAIKLIVRRLPPTLTPDQFFKIADQHGASKAAWRSYIPGSTESTGPLKRSAQINRYSVAFLAFTLKTDAIDFYNKLNGYSFSDNTNNNANASSPNAQNVITKASSLSSTSDANKNEAAFSSSTGVDSTNVTAITNSKNSNNSLPTVQYTASIERGLYQGTPPIRRKSISSSPLNGTIEQDVDYQAFLKAIENGSPLPPPGSTTTTANYNFSNTVNAHPSQNPNSDANITSPTKSNDLKTDKSAVGNKGKSSGNGIINGEINATFSSTNVNGQSALLSLKGKTSLAVDDAKKLVKTPVKDNQQNNVEVNGDNNNRTKGTSEIVTPLMEMIRQRRKEKDMKKSAKLVVRQGGGRVKNRQIQLVDPKSNRFTQMNGSGSKQTTRTIHITESKANRPIKIVDHNKSSRPIHVVSPSKSKTSVLTSSTVTNSTKANSSTLNSKENMTKGNGRRKKRKGGTTVGAMEITNGKVSGSNAGENSNCNNNGSNSNDSNDRMIGPNLVTVQTNAKLNSATSTERKNGTTQTGSGRVGNGGTRKDESKTGTNHTVPSAKSPSASSATSNALNGNGNGSDSVAVENGSTGGTNGASNGGANGNARSKYGRSPRGRGSKIMTTATVNEPVHGSVRLLKKETSNGSKT